METVDSRTNLGEYIYRQCSDYLSELDEALRADVYVLAFNINNIGGEDEKQTYVELDTIDFHANTRAHAQECSTTEDADVNVWWVPGLFIGSHLVQIPHFDQLQPLDSEELFLRDQWCAMHGVFPTSQDEAGRNVYGGSIGKQYYSALATAIEYASLRLHRSGDLMAYFDKSIPILISYDSGCEGIISIPATQRCNPPAVLVEFLSYAESIKNQHDQPYRWTLHYEDE